MPVQCRAAHGRGTVNLLEAIVLGIVEGLTEFLPVSSTGHLTIAEELLGLPIDSAAITGFTATVQIGAIVAVLLYFRKEIRAFMSAGLAGLRDSGARTGPDWQLFKAVVVGSIPVGLVGFLGRDVISGPLRDLVAVALALILFSPVMVYAESRAHGTRTEKDLTMRDAVIIGLAQSLSLIPGISRSGATISAGLLTGFDRVSATRLAFFLSIPALTAAGLYGLKDAVGGGVGVAPTLVATVVAFLVAYASIAWLLQFVAHHSIAWFVPYRVVLGVVILVVIGVT